MPVLKRLFVFSFIALTTGCATNLKAIPVEELKSSKARAFTAFVVTDESLKQETEAIAITGRNNSYEISTIDLPSLEFEGAKIFLVELPPDEYKVDGHAFGGRMYRYNDLAGEAPRFESAAGKITVLPALNLIPTDHRVISNNPIGTVLIDTEAAEIVKKTFPDRGMILGYKK